MSKKFFQKHLSVFLVLALTFTVFPLHTETVYADEHPAVAATASNEKAAGIEAVKLKAEKDAHTLTSVYSVDSVSYALIDNGDIVFSDKYTKSGHESEDPSTDMYGIGSISKMFTTTAVLQLQEQGKINLDSPVISYIPEFTMADERYKDITVRMLLNHSSGLMGTSLGNVALLEDKDSIAHDTFLKNLKSQRLKAAPGAFSVYCNDGFTLAEILVEKITGMTFSQYIRNNILNPLNLTKTATPEDFSGSSLAGTYAPLFPNRLPNETFHAIGAGGIYSSAEDLCHFAQLFMSAAPYQKVLSPMNATAMRYPEYSRGFWPAGESILSFGLGWDTVNTYPFDSYGIKAISKSGDTLRYHGSLIVLPDENMAVAVLSSGGASTYDQTMGQNILLEALKAEGRISRIKPPVSYNAPEKKPLSPDMKQYEGIYGSFGDMMKISMKDDGILSISSLVAPVPAQTFYYTGDGKFYYTDGSYYITFEKAANGNTYLYHNGYASLPDLGQVKTAGYLGEKLTDNQVPGDIYKVWQNRSGKTYFLVSEKYSSELYAFSTPFTKLEVLKGINGYWMNTAISDKDAARSPINIPENYGRDLTDYTFFKEGKTEYLKISSGIYISSDSIKPLSKSSKKYTIADNGYASWYSIDSKTGSKKVTISVPKAGAYGIYNEDGICLAHSYIKKDKVITLPEKGYIVFVGNTGSNFLVKFQ